MSDPNKLKEALERLVAGAATDADRNIVQGAMTTGVLATGQSAVALGGDASDVMITTGDQNILFTFKGADAAAVKAAMSSVTPQRLRQVPPPPADFTGREKEQQELLAAIKQGGVNISGLRGLGGIGKTALALKLVEQLKPYYPDAQLYLDLKGASTQPLTSAAALAHVIRAYHPAAKIPDNDTDLRGLYLSILDGQRALLLMDNAVNAEQVEPLIPPSSCVLLVTSRRHFTLPGIVAKNLDALNRADANALLLSIAPRIGPWADEIAELCGHLPLALRLAASALATSPNLKPQAYVQRLQNEQHRLQLIEASLNLSYELLSQGLRERWRWLAVFPDSFADDATVAVWETDMDQAQQMLSELIAASMVEWNETASRYRLHDLARVFADTKLSSAERAVVRKRHANHYKNILAAADDLYLLGGEALASGLALFDREWTNIQFGHAWVKGQGAEADEDVARICMEFPSAGAYILLLRQHPREQLAWLEAGLTAARRLGDRSYEGAALGNLGNAYKNLGDNELAIQFLKDALVILHEINDRRGEAAAMGNLGLTYGELGETDRAIQLFEQQLVIVREINHPRGEGNSLTNLGNVYANLGQTQRAIECYEQALEIQRKIGDRSGESLTLGALGMAYADLGQIQEAVQFYEKRLDIARKLGDRRGEASVLWTMSLSLEQLGQLAQAIEHAERALLIFEEIEEPRVIIVRQQVAAWREQMDQ